MDDWEIEMRNELARKFRETVPEGRRDPVLDDDGKDMTHPLYGKKHMESSKKRMAESAKGNTKRRGSKHKPESIELMKENTIPLYGEKNGNWKGGVCKDMKKYKAEYYQRRKAA